MARRTRAREAAFQILYQDDLNPPRDLFAAEGLLKAQLPSEDLVRFAWELVDGVRNHRAEMDAQIEQSATNWSLGRMAATDRNIIRLGAYELLHTDTPDRVAINESVELAKRFGGAQSAQFVNGILDRLMHEGDRE